MAGILKDAAGNEVATAFVVVENPTLYVDDTNGNDSNTGSAAGSGNALKTIQAAVDKVDQWIGTFTINLAAGTYYGGVDFNKKEGAEIILIGAAEATTIISGATSGSPTTANDQYCLRFIDCALANVQIEAMTLQYATTYGILKNRSTGRTILKDMTIKEIANSGSYGVLNYWSGVIQCNNVDIVDVGGTGFGAQSAQLDFTSAASTVVNCSKGGNSNGYPLALYFQATCNIAVSGCLFKGATSYDTICIYNQGGRILSTTGFTVEKGSIGIYGVWQAHISAQTAPTYTTISTNTALSSGALMSTGT